MSNPYCTEFLWELYIWFCRFFGLVTCLGLWGVSVEASFYHHYLGYILLAEAVIVTFCETVFLINLCVIMCKGDEDEDEPKTFCQSLWEAVLWFDNWKKGIFYFALSVPCFIEPKEVWLAIIVGVMLILCALSYSLKTCKADHKATHKQVPQSATYDRFDDIIQEDIEDHILNPRDPGPGNMCVADQEEILEL